MGYMEHGARTVCTSVHAIGGVVQPSGIQTDEWMSAQTRLVDACMGAGVDVAMEIFTGG